VKCDGKLLASIPFTSVYNKQDAFTAYNELKLKLKRPDVKSVEVTHVARSIKNIHFMNDNTSRY